MRRLTVDGVVDDAVVVENPRPVVKGVESSVVVQGGGQTSHFRSDVPIMLGFWDSAWKVGRVLFLTLFFLMLLGGFFWYGHSLSVFAGKDFVVNANPVVNDQGQTFFNASVANSVSNAYEHMITNDNAFTIVNQINLSQGQFDELVKRVSEAVLNVTNRS